MDSCEERVGVVVSCISTGLATWGRRRQGSAASLRPAAALALPAASRQGEEGDGLCGRRPHGQQGKALATGRGPSVSLGSRAGLQPQGGAPVSAWGQGLGLSGPWKWGRLPICITHAAWPQPRDWRGCPRRTGGACQCPSAMLGAPLQGMGACWLPASCAYGVTRRLSLLPGLASSPHGLWCAAWLCGFCPQQLSCNTDGTRNSLSQALAAPVHASHRLAWAPVDICCAQPARPPVGRPAPAWSATNFIDSSHRAITQPAACDALLVMQGNNRHARKRRAWHESRALKPPPYDVWSAVSGPAPSLPSASAAPPTSPAVTMHHPASPHKSGRPPTLSPACRVPAAPQQAPALIPTGRRSRTNLLASTC